MKKLLFILIGLCFFVGCTDFTPNEEVSDTKTLDWYVNFSWFKASWGEDIVSKAISEEVGVDVNLISPIGKEIDKLDALIKLGDLPDIITLEWTSSLISSLKNEDLVYALNELDKEYDGYFLEVADPVVLDWYEEDDGNIYGYPNYSYTPEDYENYENVPSNQTFLVRKDIYEAIGSPDMSTMEGFKTAIEDAKEMFGTVNDKPLIPIGSTEFTETGSRSFDDYLQNFLAVPYEKDGEFYDRYTDEEYLDWINFFRELYHDGYLNDQIFTDRRTQFEENVQNGQYFCMIYQRTDITYQQKTIYNENPDAVYIAVDGPKNSQGDEHKLPGTAINGWTLTFISKDCKEPEKALELISFMMSKEGQMLTTMGVEGETFEYIDGVPTFFPDVQKVLNENRTLFDETYGASSTYWMLESGETNLTLKPKEEEPILQPEVWTYDYTEYLGQYEVKIPADKEIEKIKYEIDELWGDTIIKLILAETKEDFDAEVDLFKQRREELGYSRLTELYTKEISESKEILGIE